MNRIAKGGFCWEREREREREKKKLLNRLWEKKEKEEVLFWERYDHVEHPIGLIHTSSDTSCIMYTITLHWNNTKVWETITTFNVIMKGGKP